MLLDYVCWGVREQECEAPGVFSSAQAAMTNGHRLDCLSDTHFSHHPGDQGASNSGRSAPGLQMAVFLLHPCMSERTQKKQPLWCLFLRGHESHHSSFTLMTSWRSICLSKTPSPCTISLGVGLQHMNLGGHVTFIAGGKWCQGELQSGVHRRNCSAG